jgi:hypothetical protein
VKKNAALNIAIDAILHITKETNNDIVQYKATSNWDKVSKAEAWVEQMREAIDVLLDLKTDAEL